MKYYRIEPSGKYDCNNCNKKDIDGIDLFCLVLIYYFIVYSLVNINFAKNATSSIYNKQQKQITQQLMMYEVLFYLNRLNA